MISIKKDILFKVSKKYGLPVLFTTKTKLLILEVFKSVDELHINYAAKALTNINILKVMKDWVWN